MHSCKVRLGLWLGEEGEHGVSIGDLEWVRIGVLDNLTTLTEHLFN